MNTQILAFITNEFFMLISSIALLKKTQYYFETQTSVSRFRKLLTAVCLYLVCDLFWAVLVYSSFRPPLPLIHVLSAVNFSFYAVIPYLWFTFVETELKSEHFTTRRGHYISLIIVLIYIGLASTSFKTGFFYTIDKDFFMSWKPITTKIIFAVLCLFFGGATLHGLIVLITSQSRIMKKKAVRVVLFILPITLGLILYQTFMLAICIPPAIFTSVLLYFLSLEDQMSYIDTLTGLFNRRKLLTLEDEMTTSALEKNPLMLYYIDIDNFKSINDTYGHIEGDKVIQYVGQALKNLDNRFNSVSIRIGGDEFIMTVNHNTAQNLDFKKAITSEVDTLLKDKDFPEPVTVSVGQTFCDDPSIPLRHYIQVADQTMYIEKHMLP